MLNELKKEMNRTHTENSGIAKATTNSKVLDFFSQSGAMRNRDTKSIYNIFNTAFAEDKELALKTLFYTRDIRGGQGERETFRKVIKELSRDFPETVKKNLKNIVEFGRWDDLFVLFDSNCESEMISLISEQLKKDIQADKPSLMGKWLKSENTSSKESREIAKKIRESLKLSPKAYRKSLTELRNKIRIIETLLTRREYKEIEYDKIPSCAGFKYRKAFFRNDEERYKNYLDAVKKGEKKINASVLYPYQIVNKVLNEYNEDSKAIEVMWENLPNYIEKEENSIAVVDTSGSMSGLPICISVSLGLYLAERSRGPYKNHFITFSESPEMQEVKGTNIVQKIINLEKAHWDMNTNIQKVFELILDVAIKNKLSNNEIIKKIYVISDMEFDRATSGEVNETVMQTIKRKYIENGYDIPFLVFWNVDARNKQFPMSIDERGFQMVSGASPSIFRALMKGESLNAYQMMLEVINSERYQSIKV